MVFVDFVILAAIFTMAVVAATQIVEPLATNRPLFPMFRRKRRELAKELTEAHNSIDNAKLKEEVKRAKANAKEAGSNGSQNPQ